MIKFYSKSIDINILNKNIPSSGISIPLINTLSSKTTMKIRTNPEINFPSQRKLVVLKKTFLRQTVNVFMNWDSRNVYSNENDTRKWKLYKFADKLISNWSLKSSLKLNKCTFPSNAIIYFYY